MNTITCPQCGRTDLKPKKNRFGDACYPQHKMVRVWERWGVSTEAAKDLAPGYNPDAAPLYELTCPMSGQAVG